MMNTRHAPFYRAIAGMRVGDCLIERGVHGGRRHALSAAISSWVVRKHPRRVVRCLFFGPRLFIVRVA